MEKDNMPTVYDPQAVETKWYEYWEQEALFHAEVEPGKKPFSIVIPPPNVTGQLHMGHALDNTLQDILIRFRRMQGYNTLWMPGTDHAGIATQIKVEENLAKEGQSRYDLGRPAFIEKVWDWKHQYGSRILTQLKRMGASCDWQRERFTMDEGCSQAVKEVFVSLYEKGLIYQGNRITNWCPRCNTALSDIEVEHEEQPGHLYHVRYPVEDSDGQYVTVATTRPETILGDSGVAVHPDDVRYRHLVGRYLVLPLVGRRLPIVADEYVDPSFGTGAVKVTPAHDPNDYDMGLRHQLEQIVVMNPDGTMAKDTGKYAGMDRYDCRRALVADLKEQGFLVKIDEHAHAVGHCQRCATVVEPLISKQWYVKMQPLAEPAIEAVTSGRIQFVPERFTKIYINWLENIRDWCISRQIWWGHRIPAWYCRDCGEITVSRTDVTACGKCGSSHVEQDPDVLDTWFSSALWPFSTMGWPENTAELKHFYPTSVLVTGYDIIFFWVARMIFMGLEFQKEIPFRHVFIHGLVRDSQGRKMSKSLGNGIDPLDVIEKYGADTLRFTLVTGNTPGNDMRFYWERIESSRNFANKIWNASRFVLMNLADFNPSQPPAGLTLADRWILSRYTHTVEAVTGNLERFELGEAARLLYDFIWNEYCDWYIEMTKGRLYDKENVAARATAQYVLWHVLSNTLRLLHPFMPFLTEEIWQHLPHEGRSVMTSAWPQPEPQYASDEAERDMSLLMDTIKAIRNMRAEMNVPPGKRSEVILQAANPSLAAVFTANIQYLKTLGASEPVIGLIQAEKPANAAAAVVNGVEVYLPLKGLIDVEKESTRLKKELDGLKKELTRIAGKLSNEGFVAKAPADVIEKEKTKQKEFQEKCAVINERLAYLATL
ncbi:valine--tRNA ligase [Acetonema longum]|uniref:Valine--tRNA ligase n=1 Tax=Acetonema longum DSM 6540 TaxID=1009370 RepID=F7NHM2_9FIRM|nr:valine--tRNA ligase [Acetonema longum]EGO64397.1 valyl-tRNA synthetase [Acetonema longum DSM 6540]